MSAVLHNGSGWVIGACVAVFLGAVGMYTRNGSGISSHPYGKSADGGDLGTDMPPEATGREEIEPLLWPRRAGRAASLSRLRRRARR